MFNQRCAEHMRGYRNRKRQGTGANLLNIWGFTEGRTGSCAHLRIPGALHEVVKADLQILRRLVAGKVQQEHTPTRAQEVPYAIDHRQHCCNCRHLTAQDSGSQQ